MIEASVKEKGNLGIMYSTEPKIAMFKGFIDLIWSDNENEYCITIEDDDLIEILERKINQ